VKPQPLAWPRLGSCRSPGWRWPPNFRGMAQCGRSAAWRHHGRASTVLWQPLRQLRRRPRRKQSRIATNTKMRVPTVRAGARSCTDVGEHHHSEDLHSAARNQVAGPGAMSRMTRASRPSPHAFIPASMCASTQRPPGRLSCDSVHRVQQAPSWHRVRAPHRQCACAPPRYPASVSAAIRVVPA
jgi:hypothetical protein